MVELDRYTLALLITGDDPPELSDAEAVAMQELHMNHLADLHERGVLLVAGPVQDPESHIRGVSILNVGVDEARALKEADPAVRAGVFRVEVMPWMFPGGAVSFTPTRFPRSIAEVSR